MTDYRQPRRINAVTVTMLLCALAAGYWFWRFFPAYFDGWTADHILKEAASRVYKINQMREPERSQELKALVDKARLEIVRTASVSDPELVVNLEIEGNTAAVTADYRVTVTHPALSRPTVLHFEKRETANIARVNWE